MNQQTRYGKADATFQALGGELGIKQLVDRFYDLMRDQDSYRKIWHWHPENEEITRDKLTRFLCGWTGGPLKYQEKYGAISIPNVHAHLKVSEIEMHMWLDCMHDALISLEHSDDLVRYLMRQLSVPAERIRQVCSRVQHNEQSQA